ncbi:hypothetical protein L1887_57263 [Cichorium endivia]|nr:hypothetical protein L1887_57263 [Cichorium endivia]
MRMTTARNSCFTDLPSLTTSTLPSSPISRAHPPAAPPRRPCRPTGTRPRSATTSPNSPSNMPTFDLSQTEQPSVFGLRRRIVAAALDHVAERPDPASGKRHQARQFQEQGLGDWLAAHTPTTNQWKDRILRKKKSLGFRHAKSAKAAQTNAGSIHDSMLGTTSPPSESSARSRSVSVTGSTSSHDKMLRRDKELAQREANFDLVVLSRFETAELKMTVYTEHRRGSWVVQGPAPQSAKVLDEPPLVFSPWDCQIDSRAIVERKKLRSFIELSDTTCAVRCTTVHQCTPPAAGSRPTTGEGGMGCKHCQGTGAVRTTMPSAPTCRGRALAHVARGCSAHALARSGALVCAAGGTRALARARRAAARGQGGAGAPELQQRRGDQPQPTAASARLTSPDGGFVRGHPNAALTEEESRIVEMPELGDALARLPVTAVMHPEATHRFVDLELVDMARSKQLSIEARSGPSSPSSPSIAASGGSTDESYSPSAFSFFQRAGEMARRIGIALAAAAARSGGFDAVARAERECGARATGDGQHVGDAQGVDQVRTIVSSAERDGSRRPPGRGQHACTALAPDPPHLLLASLHYSFGIHGSLNTCNGAQTSIIFSQSRTQNTASSRREVVGGCRILQFCRSSSASGGPVGKEARARAGARGGARRAAAANPSPPRLRKVKGRRQAQQGEGRETDGGLRRTLQIESVAPFARD